MKLVIYITSWSIVHINNEVNMEGTWCTKACKKHIPHPFNCKVQMLEYWEASNSRRQHYSLSCMRSTIVNPMNIICKVWCSNFWAFKNTLQFNTVMLKIHIIFMVSNLIMAMLLQSSKCPQNQISTSHQPQDSFICIYPCSYCESTPECL